MQLFVGLGNPGPDYQDNRHNIGFMALDRIADHAKASPFRSKFQGTIADVRLGDEKVLLLKPMTFMNKSGQAIGEAMRFYKISPQSVYVFYDELDLAPFKVKVRLGGGAAGHNGIRSAMAHIGPDFHRVRLGIGHPGDKARVNSYVLGDFAKAELDPLNALLDAVAGQSSWLAAGDGPRFMTELARTLHGERPKPPVKKLTDRKPSDRPDKPDQLKAKGPMADALKGLIKPEGDS